MDKKKVKELIEQVLNYCDQCYDPNWQPKSFKEFIKSITHWKPIEKLEE